MAWGTEKNLQRSTTGKPRRDASHIRDALPLYRTGIDRRALVEPEIEEAAVCSALLGVARHLGRTPQRNGLGRPRVRDGDGAWCGQGLQLGQVPGPLGLREDELLECAEVGQFAWVLRRYELLEGLVVALCDVAGCVGSHYVWWSGVVERGAG